METAASDGHRQTTVRVEGGTDPQPVLVNWRTWVLTDPSDGQHSSALLTGDGPVLVDPNEPVVPVAEC